MSLFKKHIFVCENIRDNALKKEYCAQKGSKSMRMQLKKVVAEHDPDKNFRVNSAGCLGKCKYGPVMVIYPQGTWYGGFDENNLKEIISESILNDRVIERLQIKE